MISSVPEKRMNAIDGVPVLPLERSDLEELRAERRRDGDLDRDAVDAREGLDRSSDVRRGTEQCAHRPSPRRERPARPRSRRSPALTRISPASDVASISTVRGRRRPADQELAVRLADEEELEPCRSGARRASSAGSRPPTSAAARSRAACGASRTPHAPPGRRDRRPRTAASSASPPNLRSPPPCA